MDVSESIARYMCLVIAELRGGFQRRVRLSSVMFNKIYILYIAVVRLYLTYIVPKSLPPSEDDLTNFVVADQIYPL